MIKCRRRTELDIELLCNRRRRCEVLCRLYTSLELGETEWTEEQGSQNDFLGGVFMRIGKYVSLVITLFLMCDPSRADFKYTQQSKVTGGALVGMTKTLGVFSKNMRQVTEPQISTTMLKDNRLREERATGEIEIIDLDGRRFIRIDPAKKTYTVMTFDEFKAALQRAKERAKA